MAKSTFHNLSEEKKERIFNAALREFSTRRFSETSLNKIIKDAGIPKGSFYQYFDNKEDLYLCLLEVGSKEYGELLKNIKEAEPDADVFEVILYETREFHERGKVKPEYIEAAMLMGLDNSDFIVKLRKASTDKYVKLVERDKQRGLIKPDTDSELVINLISTFSYSELFRNGSDKAKYLKNLSGAIQIIKESVSTHRD